MLNRRATLEASAQSRQTIKLLARGDFDQALVAAKRELAGGDDSVISCIDFGKIRASLRKAERDGSYVRLLSEGRLRRPAREGLLEKRCCGCFGVPGLASRPRNIVRAISCHWYRRNRPDLELDKRKFARLSRY